VHGLSERPSKFDAVTVEGITNLTATDMRCEENMGTRINLSGHIQAYGTRA
jgi:hypothetical protein